MTASAGATARLANAVLTRAGRPLPPEVAVAARALLATHLAAAVGGSGHPAVLAVLATVGPERAGSGVALPGRPERPAPLDAALAIGTAMLVPRGGDDRQAAGVGFPAPAAVLLASPWANAAGESRRLAAFALGCEVQLALDAEFATAAAGWDGIGIWGVFGAATTALLLRSQATLDGPALARCWGLAAGQTVGHGVARGTDIGALHGGVAAANGLLAAALVGQDFTAPEQIFDAARALPAALGTAPSGARALAALSGPWQLTGPPTADSRGAT